MKTPNFWSESTLWSRLLWPVSAMYEIISTMRRSFTTSVTLPVPVICIGNLTAGGAGKTPVALHIGKLFKEKNIPAFYLSRGYGGVLKGPVLVDLKKHTARDVGDEPLLLAKLLPTIVSKDRVAGGRMAVASGAKIIIMDDGFQNQSIAKTLSFIVIDGKNGFGNGKIIPAGPLREPPKEGFRRAHAVIVINRTPMTPTLPDDMPVITARTQAATQMVLKGKKLIAFCGLAHPEKFFETLAQTGASPVETIVYPDHHPYSQAEWRKMVAKANKIQAGLVTTAKDAVRLPSAIRSQVSIVDIELVFDNAELLDAFIDYALNPNEKT